MQIRCRICYKITDVKCENKTEGYAIFTHGNCRWYEVNGDIKLAYKPQAKSTRTARTIVTAAQVVEALHNNILNQRTA